MHILLVENDELLGECIRCGLGYYRYDVEWVKYGSEAWRVLQTKYFDMVILDFDLLKSGEEVLKNMRLNGITTPIIIMSSSDDVCDCVKGLDIGADDYIGKPFEMEELCARIRTTQKRVTAKKE